MITSSKPRILIIGDAVAPTGFARVIRNIFEPLHAQFELHQMATRFEGGTHNYPWQLYEASKGTSVYGYDQIATLLREIQPAIVFLLYDIPFHNPYMERIVEPMSQHTSTVGSQGPPKIVMYAPVESGPIAPEMIQKLGSVSRYVLYTEYGRREIERTIQTIRQTDPDFRFPDLEVISHGVDTEKFFPLDAGSDDQTGSIPLRRLMAREALGFDDAEHRESFIVLNANRNMPRKRIDITMQGFAQFARDKPRNVKLYLHMATEDTGWNVLILARRHGIFERLIMTRADNARPTFSDEQLNLLYNSCDVGVTTTTGEGWGLVSFEHAATKSAQIVPRHTSLADLWQGAAAFVEPVMKLTYPGNLTEGHIVTPESVAASLERLYCDVDYRNAMAEAAYRNATRAEFNWQAISARWSVVFNELLSQ